MLNVKEFNQIFKPEMVAAMRRWLAVERRSIKIEIDHDPLLNKPNTKTEVWCWDACTSEGFFAEKAEDFLAFEQLRQRSIEKARKAYEMKTRRMRRAA